MLDYCALCHFCLIDHHHLIEPSQISDVTASRTRMGTAITVSWRLLSLVEARGIISSYVVNYTQSTAAETQSNTEVVGPNMSSVTIDSLDTNTAYDISVQAKNDAGLSPPANEFVQAGEI